MSPDRVTRQRAGGAGAADEPVDVTPAGPAGLEALRRPIAALEHRTPALQGAVARRRAARPWPLGVGTLADALHLKLFDFSNVAQSQSTGARAQRSRAHVRAASRLDGSHCADREIPAWTYRR